MRQHRTVLLPCLALLFTAACAGARPAAEPAASAPAKPAESTPASTPAAADFLSISRPGSSYQARWSQVSVAPGSGGFRTDLFAKASGDEELVEAHFVLIRLRGPGEYPLGFGWDRGQSRATLRTREGMNCMTPGSDAGAIEFTVAPAGEALAPGDRLEGRYRIHCFPDAKASPGQQPLVFTGEFAVTVGER